jgi:L-alanine-DL-glutamate epimerase-like enolase superfamily enzyme
LGKSVTKGGSVLDLLREDAVDIIRPDIGLNGITQIRRMAATAEVCYVAVGPVHNGGPIGTAAALHLAASIPNFFIQEMPFPEAEEDQAILKVFGVSVTPTSDRPYVFIKLETDAGVVGWGEATLEGKAGAAMACDFHAKTSAAVASVIVKEIEPLNLLFVEELTPPENNKALARIAKRSTTPIAAGERLVAAGTGSLQRR